MLAIIIQLIAGAIGGNAAGAVLKNQSLGGLGNTIAGVVGGGLGGQILAMMSTAAPVAAGSGMDMASIVGSVVSGGVGGGVLMAIVGVLKGMMAK